MMSEGTRRLNQIAKAINELDHPWKTIDPAAADELSRQYERRSQLWKKKIALQCAALILVQAVSSEGDVLGDAAISASESVPAENLDDDKSENANNTSMQQDLDETREILAQCPAIWNGIKSDVDSLRQSIEGIMSSQVRELENRPDTDWSSACDTMKDQRDNLQEDIRIIRERVLILEERNTKPALKLLHDNVNELRKVKDNLKTLLTAQKEMEVLLEEHHGIVASQGESTKTTDLSSSLGVPCEDLDDFLAEEQEAMISYYEAKIDRNARIVDVTSARKAGSNLIDVTVTPKSDWLEYWRRKKPDHPGLKYVTITYSRDSIYPTNIAIKVDTSNVSEGAFDAVMGPLISRTQEWKQKMLESPCLDLHGLIRLFL